MLEYKGMWDLMADSLMINVISWYFLGYTDKFLALETIWIHLAKA